MNDNCPGAPTVPFLETFITVFVVLTPCFVLTVAATGYPPTAPLAWLRFARFLRRATSAIFCLAGIVGGLGIWFFGAQSRDCGGADSPYLGVFELVALFAFSGWIVGAAIDTKADWLVIGHLAVLDVLFAAVSLEVGGQHAVTIGILFGLHAVYTAVGTWWSWRLRGAPLQHRAAASEAGRILASGWLVLLVLFIAANFDHEAAKSLLDDSQLVSILVITATTVAVGAGYTRYAQAIAAHTKPAPRVTGRPAAVRDRLARAGRWLARPFQPPARTAAVRPPLMIAPGRAAKRPPKALR